jgi:hypothetical protein
VSVAVIVWRVLTAIPFVMMVVAMNRAVRMAMLVRVRRVEWLPALAVDVPIDRAVHADVFMNPAFDRHFAGTAAAGRAHSLVLLQVDRAQSISLSRSRYP